MKKSLSREKVLSTAVRLADSDGIGVLSMRNLAGKIGVEAMSLYNHVRNKDDLLLGMAEHVAGEFYLPVVGGDWKAEMHKRAVTAHQVLVRHPWASQLFVSQINTGTNVLGYADTTIGCLVEAGFTYPQADHAWNAIDSHVYGFTLQQLNFPFQPEDFAEAASHHMPDLSDGMVYLRRMAELVMNGRHDGVQDFTFGLNLILDGLAAKLNR